MGARGSVGIWQGAMPIMVVHIALHHTLLLPTIFAVTRTILIRKYLSFYYFLVEPIAISFKYRLNSYLVWEIG